MEPIFELPLTLPAPGSRERLRALHSQLRAAIIDGRLKPGLRLPPTRDLAAAYRVSRNTAIAAYDLLLAEGYVTSRRGSGTFVAWKLPSARRVDARNTARSARQSAARSSPHQRLTRLWRTPGPCELMPLQGCRFDFRIGIADKRLFPFEVWRRLHARTLRMFAKAPDRPEDPRGRERLREAIAGHVSFARAVACGPDDIIVTAGAQQAFDLLARVLVEPGRTTVAVENPGYRAMWRVLRAAGARIAPVPADSKGMVVSRIPASARVICVTPSHQFPLGSVLAMERRIELLELARRRGAVILEDDYDGEFRFGGRPLDALQTLDRSECVFYIGTFSKSTFPGIRAGYIVAPPWARDALAAAKRCADGYAPAIAQEVLASFIAEGHLARHVRKMRNIYAARRATLLECLRDLPGQWLEPVDSAAGLHLTGLAPPRMNLDALVARAAETGTAVPSIRPCYLGPPGRDGLTFGYGLITEREIPDALELLARARRSPSQAASPRANQATSSW